MTVNGPFVIFPVTIICNHYCIFLVYMCQYMFSYQLHLTYFITVLILQWLSFSTCNCWWPNLKVLFCVQENNWSITVDSWSHNLIWISRYDDYGAGDVLRASDALSWVDGTFNFCLFCICHGYLDPLSILWFFLLVIMRFSLGPHLCVKIPRPGDSEVTFSIFESSCHLLPV